MKTKLDKELKRMTGGAGTPWDGIISVLAAAAFDPQNKRAVRWRVRLALVVLPMVAPVLLRTAKRQAGGKK